MDAPSSPIAGMIRETLADLRAAGLLRSFRTIENVHGARISMDGREFVNAASNSMLGLTTDPRVVAAAKQAVDRWGVGGGASRLVAGHMTIHRELEERLADFKRAEAALVFPTGYAANTGTISALVGEGDTVVVDKLSHASIIDGARLSGARVRSYAHCDTGRLEGTLEKSSGARLVVTDSVFSMDGDLAPLEDIVRLCDASGATCMVDEAHAGGVLGERGSGAVEAAGLEGRIPVVMGTLSKGLGSLGGFVCGDRDLVAFLRNRARAFIYTTALPPACAAAALAALDIVEKEPERRRRVRELAARVWEAARPLNASTAKRSGHSLPGTQPPAAHIVPVVVGSVGNAAALSKHLAERCVFAPAIRPPTVPQGTARVRISLMATHSDADVQRIVDALGEFVLPKDGDAD